MNNQLEIEYSEVINPFLTKTTRIYPDKEISHQDRIEFNWTGKLNDSENNEFSINIYQKSIDIDPIEDDIVFDKKFIFNKKIIIKKIKQYLDNEFR